MDARAFSALFPKLYHVTFAANLAGIEQHGLLSANALGELHQFDEAEREAALVQRRRCIQMLHGVSIRDQHAAPDRKMKSCLVGITIPEWLALLNGKVFFFVDKEKALEFAGRYSDYANVLIEVDTGRLLEGYASKVTLCRINSGAFLYNPRPRGRDSFIPLEDYVYRKKRDAPVELTVDGGVGDLMEFAVVGVG